MKMFIDISVAVIITIMRIFLLFPTRFTLNLRDKNRSLYKQNVRLNFINKETNKNTEEKKEIKKGVTLFMAQNG